VLEPHAPGISQQKTLALTILCYSAIPYHIESRLRERNAGNEQWLEERQRKSRRLVVVLQLMG